MLTSNQPTHFSELWDQVCLGNQQAYASLHRQLYTCLYHYANRILNDQDDANDVIQELFVKLWDKRTTIGKIQHVKSYFYRALRSTAINHLRGLKTQESRNQYFSLVDLELSTEEHMIAEEYVSEQKCILKRALDKLPVKQREIIYLRFYEDLNYNQIVEITGIKYQSVVNHIHRAITQLRTELNPVKNKHAA